MPLTILTTVTSRRRIAPWVTQSKISTYVCVVPCVILQVASCMQIADINDISDYVTGWTTGKRSLLTGSGKSFLQTSRPALGPTQPPIQSVPGRGRGRGCFFPGGNAARACSLLLTSSSAEVRNECKLYPKSSVFLYGLHNNNITFAVIGMTWNKKRNVNK